MSVNVHAKWPVSDRGIWPPASHLESRLGVSGLSALQLKLLEADATANPGAVQSSLLHTC